jgi:hypothetical protein
VVILGLLVRLVLGGAGIGDRSGIVMALLLVLAAWLAARIFAGPRLALLVTVAAVALMDLSALPARNAAEYDDLQAFYATDQVLATQLTLPAGLDHGEAVITLLAKPVFQAGQPRFGLAGEVNGTSLQWSCAFDRGVVQRLALPVPPVVTITSQTPVDVRLHLSGSPSRESDYLVVYSSSRRGGFVVALDPAAMLDQGVTRCTIG